MRRGYIFTFLILLAIQVVLGDLLNLTQYVILSYLPVMIMSLPVTYGTPKVLIIAFATGFAVDFLTHGVLGLTVSALLPVAFARNTIVKLVFGSELLSRQENISIHKQGPAKVLLGTFLATLLYFAVYVPVDCAGTRSLGFIMLRILLSLAVSTPVSYYVAGILSPLEADRWR